MSFILKLDRYILVDGIPVPEPNLLTWAMWFETADRRIAQTEIGDLFVSTVFLGLDASWGPPGTPPLLFETMVFGPPRNVEPIAGTARYATINAARRDVEPIAGTPARYSTIDEARRGHDEVCARVAKERGLAQ